jgi:hypothetical protein
MVWEKSIVKTVCITLGVGTEKGQKQTAEMMEGRCEEA